MLFHSPQLPSPRGGLQLLFSKPFHNLRLCLLANTLTAAGSTPGEVVKLNLFLFPLESTAWKWDQHLEAHTS